MLDLQQLQTFQTVAQTSHFGRAAEALGCSQPTVTTRIKALERRLGASLLQRTRFSKTTILTDTGRRLLEFTDRILALASETAVAVQGADSLTDGSHYPK